MSGINNAINVAYSGLQVFEAGISAVSNNLANVTTTGYAAESVLSLTAQGGYGQPGAGVQAPVITRASGGFATTQLWAANSASQAASVMSSSLTNISNALQNNGDVQTAVNQFFNDVSALAANPSSTAQRQTVLADAGQAAGVFNTASAQLGGVVTSAQTAVGTQVTSANDLLTQLQQINKNLVQDPNSPSLLDQQTAALDSLSKILPVSVIPQQNGSVLVTSGGTVLLDQSGAQNLSASTSGAGAVTVKAGNGGSLALGAADGALGAQVATIQAAQAATQSVSALATVFGLTVNAAQSQGLTLKGKSGTALFSVPAPQVTAGSANTGTATVTASISSPASLPLDGGPFQVSYNATSGWSAVDQASGASYPVSGTPPSFAGIALAVSGTPATGDRFLVNPAPNAATGISAVPLSTADIAAADPYVASAGTLQADGSISNNNGGTVSAGADTVVSTPSTSAAVVPASYYGQNLQINFSSASSYTVSVAGSTTPIIASGTLGANGGNVAVSYPSASGGSQYWQLPISGTPVAGDTMTLTPGGSASGSNAQRMASLWTSSSGTAAGSLEGGFISLATQLGQNASSAQNLATSTSAQLTTATSNLQNIVGVSSDQQGVLLTSYQQSYQAAAQAISIAHSMFESLVQVV
ncbi:FlgK family flagellar hook-associated protein [Acidocella sp.]|uniref:FlgK family flagellar hook-associated protein n=1 Tax=Acidocella sp. TaxID=50710 RepID=UPI002623A54E|nr:flagellar basal body rod C-terminal domain-containing protein [Acidocella sp.]